MHITELLNESFNSSYKFRPVRVGSSREEYVIQSAAMLDGETILYMTYIMQSLAMEVPELAFSRVEGDEEEIDTTMDFQETGENPMKLFSTIMTIAQRSPMVIAGGGFWFEAHDRKKERFYLTMMSRFGYTVERMGGRYKVML